MTTCADLKTEGDHKWKQISTELSLFVPPGDVTWVQSINKGSEPCELAELLISSEEEWWLDSQDITKAMEVRTVQYECSERHCSAKQETKITVNQPGFQRDLDEFTHR